MAKVSLEQARKIWMYSQGLDDRAPFGYGLQAAQAVIEHLGYVQIDTINVIERCHHHILYSRIPEYQQSYLHLLQAQEKTIFEYWTHALAYIPVRDYRFYIGQMRAYRKDPGVWFSSVKEKDLKKVLNLIRTHGAISIRDINDDVLVEKNHPWASRKPSKKALQMAFYCGQVTISERLGMLKKYELAERHFGEGLSKTKATESETDEYYLQRALTSQGIVTVDSSCYLSSSRKPGVRKKIEKKVKSGELMPVSLDGDSKNRYYLTPETFEMEIDLDDSLVHILSPFDPLIIQRKRLFQFFGYEHRFEAYIPKEKRRFGYFGLPVVVGDQVVAVLDLKTNREAKKLQIQKWTWLGKFKSPGRKKMIESELDRFEKFQLLKK